MVFWIWHVLSLTKKSTANLVDIPFIIHVLSSEHPALKQFVLLNLPLHISGERQRTNWPSCFRFPTYDVISHQGSSLSLQGHITCLSSDIVIHTWLFPISISLVSLVLFKWYAFLYSDHTGLNYLTFLYCIITYL